VGRKIKVAYGKDKRKRREIFTTLLCREVWARYKDIVVEHGSQKPVGVKPLRGLEGGKTFNRKGKPPSREGAKVRGKGEPS